MFRGSTHDRERYLSCSISNSTHQQALPEDRGWDSIVITSRFLTVVTGRSGGGGGWWGRQRCAVHDQIYRTLNQSWGIGIRTLPPFSSACPGPDLQHKRKFELNHNSNLCALVGVGWCGSAYLFSSSPTPLPPPHTHTLFPFLLSVCFGLSGLIQLTRSWVVSNQKANGPEWTSFANAN